MLKSRKTREKTLGTEGRACHGYICTGGCRTDPGKYWEPRSPGNEATWVCIFRQYMLISPSQVMMLIATECGVIMPTDQRQCDWTGHVECWASSLGPWKSL